MTTDSDRIPGITITLNENPLASTITLSDSARREFILRFALREMENAMWEVNFRLDKAHSAYDPDAAARAVAYFTEFEGHDAYPECSFAFWEAYSGKRNVDHYLSALNEEHCGDCTAVACSCIRCHAEQLAGIYTGAPGKHIGAAVSGMFVPKPSSPQLIAEALERKQQNDAYWEKYKAERPDDWEKLQVTWENDRKRTADFMEKHRQLLAEQNAALQAASPPFEAGPQL